MQCFFFFPHSFTFEMSYRATIPRFIRNVLGWNMPELSFKGLWPQLDSFFHHWCPPTGSSVVTERNNIWQHSLWSFNFNLPCTCREVFSCSRSGRWSLYARQFCLFPFTRSVQPPPTPALVLATESASDPMLVITALNRESNLSADFQKNKKNKLKKKSSKLLIG